MSVLDHEFPLVQREQAELTAMAVLVALGQDLEALAKVKTNLARQQGILRSSLGAAQYSHSKVGLAVESGIAAVDLLQQRYADQEITKQVILDVTPVEKPATEEGE